MARKVKRQARKPVARVSKDIPALVKVISIFGYIGAICTLLLGILFLVGSSFIKDAIINNPQGLSAQEIATISAMGPGFLIFFGIVFIGLAVLDFFVARGLWKGQNWARIFMIVILAIAAVSSLMDVITGGFGSIISLIIEALLIWYFAFNKNVIEAF